MGNRSLLTTAFALLMSVSMLTAGLVHAAPPPFQLDDNIPAYRLALERSTDPQSKRILQEIANGPADLAKAKTAALKDGISITSKVTMPPPDQNAAPLYDKWFPIQGNYPLYAQPMTLRYQYTPEEIAAVWKVFDDSKVANALLMKAVKKPYAIYSDADFPSSFSRIARLRSAARQVQTLATMLALKGQWRDAADMQVTGLTIQRQVEDRPSFLGHLVANAIEAITLVGLQSILNHSTPNAHIATIVRTAVSADADDKSMKKALQGDAVSQLNLLDTVKKKMTPGSVTDESKDVFSPKDGLFVVQLIDAGEARYLNVLRAAVEVADESPLRRRTALARQEEMADALNEHITNDPTSVFGETSMNYLVLAKQDDARIAREKVTLAAAVILSVKAKTGRFPSRLRERFIDPFSGKSLLYRRDGQGFVVYSVGPTGHFNGNSVPDHSAWENVFRYPAPPPIPLPKNLLQN